MSRITSGPTSWKVSDQTLGSSFGGGLLICKSGGVGWIVAPSSTQVTRTWYCRNDAVTTAQANAACGDWFVPTISQLVNPGLTCATRWDSYASGGFYWSSTEISGSHAFYARFPPFTGQGYNVKTATSYVRAFRCVTY